MCMWCHTVGVVALQLPLSLLHQVAAPPLLAKLSFPLQNLSTEHYQAQYEAFVSQLFVQGPGCSGETSFSPSLL
jgi:hypothetical protein